MDVKYDWDATTGRMPQRQYFYDARGRLQRMLDSTAQTTGPLCEGLVDPNNGGTPCLPDAVKTYAGQDTVVYDRVGNVSAAVTPEANGTTVLSRNRMTGWPQASGSAKMTYTFDAAGQRRTWDKGVDQTTRYWWSPDGLLDSVRVGASTRRLLYQYNAFGQLVRRMVNGVVSRHYVWDGDDLLAELDSTLGARRSDYAHYPGVDEPYALLTGATAVTETRFIQRDGLGNVLGLTTAGGSVAIDGLETEVWGYVPGVGRPPITAQDTLRLGWKGLLYEADSTQLYYVRARWYDPKTRRFVTEDPIGLEGGINPYTFAENDPVNASDPSGLEPCRFEATISYISEQGPVT